MDSQQYLAYLSHSWRSEHIDLNISLWEQLWSDCWLRVDDNTEDAPPYYVARLEHLMRLSDCFVAFVPPEPHRPAGAPPSAMSPYIQFELVLAERAGLPRLVIADPSITLPPSMETGALSQLIVADFGALQRSGAESPAWAEVREWIHAIKAASAPRPQRQPARVGVLMPRTSRSATCEAIEDALRRAGCREVIVLAPEATDLELLREVRRLDLLVADVGSPELWDRYGVAHGAALPTIRVAQATKSSDGPILPTLLRGHAQGYDQDVIVWRSEAELADEMTLRVRSLLRPAIVVDTLEEGLAYFGRRRGL